MAATAVGLAADDGDDGVVAGEPPMDTSVRGVSVAPDALRPPGTPLAPGVEVVPGSRLVASVFPLVDFYPEEPSDQAPIGWQALLVVDGDPVDVWNAYATALGLVDADAVSTCVVTSLPTPATASTSRPQTTVEVTQQARPQRFLTEAPLEGENRLDCHILTPAVTMTMAVGATTCRSEGDVPCSLVPIAHLKVLATDDPEPSDYEQRGTDELRYERAIPSTGQSGIPEPVAIPEGPVVSPSLEVPGGSGLPEEGERFDRELDYFLDRTDVAFIPSGGRSLVAPAMLLECNSGLVAILELPGSPADVVDEFDRADTMDDPLVLTTGQDADGRSWAGGLISTAGGYYVDFVALDAGDETSTVSITECGD